jgi:phosphatidylserine/phosphatidylglycerophosphate/cardiolipin synthase-like enzyme
MRFLALFVAAAGCLAADGPTLTFVETAPIETSLGSDDLPETFEVWLDMIQGAERSIELAHFYASNRPGSRLEPVVLALLAAAERGVSIRFLADAGFHRTYPETLDRLDAAQGVEVRLLDLRSRTGGVLHAKYMLVDARELYLGSANFDWRSLEHIQELGVRVRDASIARAIGDVFELDWGVAAGTTPPAPRGGAADFPVALRFGEDAITARPALSPAELLPDAELWDLPRLVEWIDAAERSLRVQLLTYRALERDSYFDTLETALRRAAARGVRVRLLVADWGKRRGTIEGLKSLSVLPNVEVRMATIPAAKEGFIPFARVVHAKYMVADEQRVWIGTSNWSADYFHASRNVGLLLEGASVARRVSTYFDAGWSGPYAYPVEAGVEYEPPRVGD